MSRAEFMSRLTALLQDVPPAEREEAIAYYNEYFDDAGEGNEAGVIWARRRNLRRRSRQGFLTAETRESLRSPVSTAMSRGTRINLCQPKKRSPGRRQTAQETHMVSRRMAAGTHTVSR